MTENSVVTFSVRASEEWDFANNNAAIYIFYDGVACGKITTSGKLWDGATATGLRDRFIHKNKVSVTNIFANGTLGTKKWVDVTISFEGIANPDLTKLSIAYATNNGSDYSGLLNTDNAKGQSNSWIYISDVKISENK